MYTTVVCLISYFSYSQTTLSFDYDSSGNQTVREIICLGCRQSMEEVANPELLQSKEHLGIRYYPNPVTTELFIEWDIKENDNISSIEVFSVKGDLIITMKNPKNSSSAILNFTPQAEGLYNIILLYESGNKKTLKVIKK